MKRKQPAKQAASCLSRQQLLACLEPIGEPSVAEQEHLGSCGVCQDRLDQLSAPPASWQEIATALKSPAPASAGRIARSVCPLRDDDQSSDEATAAAIADFHCSHELETLQAKLEPASHPELLGRLDRYEVEQLVGYGGMGLVFRGHDTELHRVVAIKTIASGLSAHGPVRQRFVREARAVASLAHPHIVSVHDIITTGPVPAIVMQYVAGPTLDQHLRDNGAIPWRSVLQLAIQLCDALDTAHRSGLIHRDIKPGNVLLEAGCTRAMLTDFGLVRVLDNKTITRTGVLAGTPEYMSPEQAWGKSLDARSDLFSLGSLLYTMLVGTSPFAAAEPMASLNRLCNEPHRPLDEHSVEIPRQVTHLVDRLLSKQPRRRYANAAEVRGHMQELLQSDISLQSRSRFGRHKSALSVVAVIACLSVLALYWLKPQFSEYVATKSYFAGVANGTQQRMTREEAVEAALAAGASPFSVQPETYSGYEVFESTAREIYQTQRATRELEAELLQQQGTRPAFAPGGDVDQWPEVQREVNDLKHLLDRIESTNQAYDTDA
ncbi:MAG: hypothetical protein Aurels2KO_04940 [Aureliella sp.]